MLMRNLSKSSLNSLRSSSSTNSILVLVLVFLFLLPLELITLLIIAAEITILSSKRVKVLLITSGALLIVTAILKTFQNLELSERSAYAAYLLLLFSALYSVPSFRSRVDSLRIIILSINQTNPNKAVATLKIIKNLVFGLLVAHLIILMLFSFTFTAPDLDMLVNYCYFEFCISLLIVLLITQLEKLKRTFK